MAEPVLVVRVAANITELRKNMLEGTATIETTKSAMTSMANSFDGSKIVSQAGAVMAQIEAIGGATKLTSTEQSRANGILEAALDKYRALGREAPPGMQALADATRDAHSAQSDLLDKIGLAGGRMDGLSAATSTAAGSTHALTSTYRQFDGVLQAAGINIGPQVKGIEDIANAAGGGASKIGMLGSAGLALGVGMAAWGITRAAMEFLGLDKNVAAAWTTILGFADSAAETVAAKIDVINRAIANGAKETITYAEAVRFNIRAKQEESDAYAVSAERLAAAQRAVGNLSAEQIRAIEIAQRNGAKTEEITRHFHISADALKALADRQKLAADMADLHTKRLQEQAKAAEVLDRQYEKLMSDTKNANQLAIMEADAARMSAEATQKKLEAGGNWMQMVRQHVEGANAQKTAEAALQAQQGSGITIIGQTAQEYAAAGTAADTAGKQSINAFAGVAQQVQITGEGLREYINLMRYTAASNAILSENSLFTSTSQRQRIAELPSPRAFGGPVMAGSPYMVGERGPELFVPERSGTIVPNGGGSHLTIAPVIHVSGGSGSPSDISAAVADAILNLFRSGAIPFPSPV